MLLSWLMCRNSSSGGHVVFTLYKVYVYCIGHWASSWPLFILSYSAPKFGVCACPFVGIGSPHPLPRKRVCLPHWTHPGREEQHSLAGGGWGTQLGRLERKHSTLYTLCLYVSYAEVFAKLFHYQWCLLFNLHCPVSHIGSCNACLIMAYEVPSCPKAC
jgi:hypothetical protein